MNQPLVPPSWLASSNSLFLEGCADRDAGFVADERDIFSEAEVGPLHASLRIEADQVGLLSERIDSGAVQSDIEHDGTSDVMHRQGTGHLQRSGPGLHRLGGREMHVGIVFRIEKLVRKQLSVELAVGGFDERDRHLDVEGRRGDSLRIEHQRARGAGKGAPEFGHAEVVHAVSHQRFFCVQHIRSLLQSSKRYRLVGMNQAAAQAGSHRHQAVSETYPHTYPSGRRPPLRDYGPSSEMRALSSQNRQTAPNSWILSPRPGDIPRRSRQTPPETR